MRQSIGQETGGSAGGGSLWDGIADIIVGLGTAYMHKSQNRKQQRRMLRELNRQAMEREAIVRAGLAGGAAWLYVAGLSVFGIIISRG